MDAFKLIQQYIDYSNLEIAHNAADGFAQKLIEFITICESIAHPKEKDNYKQVLELVTEARRIMMQVDNISMIETKRLNN